MLSVSVYFVFLIIPRCIRGFPSLCQSRVSLPLNPLDPWTPPYPRSNNHYYIQHIMSIPTLYTHRLENTCRTQKYPNSSLQKADECPAETLRYSNDHLVCSIFGRALIHSFIHSLYSNEEITHFEQDSSSPSKRAQRPCILHWSTVIDKSSVIVVPFSAGTTNTSLAVIDTNRIEQRRIVCITPLEVLVER